MIGDKLRVAMNGVAAIIGSALALFLIANAFIDRSHERSRTMMLEKDVMEKQQRAVNHAAYAAQLEQMRAMLSQLNERLPAHLDNPLIEKTLRDNASIAGIEMSRVTVGAERVRDGFYGERPVDVVVQGAAASFWTFMESTLRDFPMRSIAELSVEPVEGTTELRATFRAMYFRYIELNE